MNHQRAEMPSGATSALTDGSAHPVPPSEPQSPPVIPDHELTCCIGRGSYGEVWLGRNLLGVWRAVKVVYRRHFEHDRPFEREFEGIRKFDPVSREHPSQLHILHVGRNTAGGYFYYVMELADPAEPLGGAPAGADGVTGALGSDRAARIIDPANYTPRTLKLELYRRVRLPVEECLRVGLALTTALEHLHRHGLVHRDIKPSNIIFVNGVPKLADIGLVASMDATMSVVGTSGFLAPEGPGTPQADLYSLGKVLYEMCMGRDRQDFPRLPADLRQFEDSARVLELNAIILKACQSDARQRYQSAGELAADLLLLQRGESVRRVRTMERRLALLSKAGAGIAAMLVLAAGLYWNAARQARATERQLYVADMNRALQAWDEGNVGLARELLATHRRRQPAMLGFEWRLLAGFCEQSDAWHTLRGHDGIVWGAAFAPDGETLATASGDGTVKLWDTASGRLGHTLPGHGHSLHAVAFSPDGSLLASGSRDFTVKLWEVASRAEVGTLSGHTDAVRTVMFSADGQYLVSGGEDSTLRWWSVAARKEAACCAAGLKVEQIAFSPQRGELALCGSDNKVHLWNYSTRQKTGDLALHQAQVLTVAYSSDGRILASGSYDGTIRLWDTLARVELAVLGRGAPVRCVAFAPGDKFLAAATEDGLVRIWDVSRHDVLSTLRGHTANVRALAFSPRQGLLASGDEDCVAKLWRVPAAPGHENALIHTGIVNSVAFSPDGSRLVSTDPSVDTLRLWDAPSQQQLAATHGAEHAVWCVAFAPDGQVLATGGVDASVRLWSPTDLSQVALLDGHKAAVDVVAFSPDSRWLASGSRDFTAKLWDRFSGRELASFSGSGRPVRAVVFAPKGRLLATGSADGLVRLWNLRSLRLEATLTGHRAEVRALAYSPDGTLLAAGGADRTIQVWNVGSRKTLATLPGHSAMVSSLAFSTDAKTLASGSWDSTVKLWNLALFREVATLRVHSGQVTQVGFSPDGHMLASASSDGTVRLWRATSTR